MSGKRKQDKNKNRKKMLYAVSVSALIALVGAAFFSPGWVFGIQDGRQCSDIVLEERESVDVAVLSTNYESSFYQRMVNFAENRTESADFYVASEELTDYQGLNTFLKSDRGLYRDNLIALMDMGLLTEAFFSCEVRDWKQYVVYSDDYAKGVNFILWYIELESEKEEGVTYKLLVEADTGEVYGIHADSGGVWNDRYNKVFDDFNLNLNRFLGFSTYEDYLYLWENTAYYFSGLTETDFYDWFGYFLYDRGLLNAVLYKYDSELVDADLYKESYYNEIYGKEAVNKTGTNATDAIVSIEWPEEDMTMDELQWVEEWGDFLQKNPPLFRVLNDGNRLECSFPYGESSLAFRIEMAESVLFPWKIKDITIGFPAVYELIPEFTQFD